MKILSNNQEVFLALLRAGLWEQDVMLSSCGEIDFSDVYRIAEEQSVVGLVAAGFEHNTGTKAPQEILLTFVGTALQLEKRNKEMNLFIAKLIERMREVGIYALLVKGQGVAQNYERPLWRASGDIDFYLSEENYNKSMLLLKPLASRIDNENEYTKHCGMTINSWEIELHGSLRSGLWEKLEHVLDNVQYEVFCGGAVRSWMNGNTQVFLPRVDEDVFYVFSHILQHFYKEGVGLRQICDWCRLLWTNKDSINLKLLESRIREAGVMTEWKTFASLAVHYLGMPNEAMPFYTKSRRWLCNGSKTLSIILESGNFGHNNDFTYYNKSYWKYKYISFMRHSRDSAKRFLIFPRDSFVMWMKMIYVGIKELFQRKYLSN